jgi:hypothetical protein
VSSTSTRAALVARRRVDRFHQLLRDALAARATMHQQLGDVSPMRLVLGSASTSCTVPTMRPAPSSATSSARSPPETPSATRRQNARAVSGGQRPHEADRGPARDTVDEHVGQLLHTLGRFLRAEAAARG